MASLTNSSRSPQTSWIYRFTLPWSKRFRVRIPPVKKEATCGGSRWPRGSTDWIFEVKLGGRKLGRWLGFDREPGIIVGQEVGGNLRRLTRGRPAVGKPP